jgi:hypothetical protein
MELLSLRGVISIFLLSHGRVGLACVRGYARKPTKHCESWIYDRDRVSYLFVLEDPASLAPVREYIMACMVFFE